MELFKTSLSGDELAQNPRELQKIFRTFIYNQRKELDILTAYKLGENYHILQKTRPSNPKKSDFRVSTPFGQYVPEILSSCAVGAVPTLSSEVRDREEILAYLERINFSKLIKQVAFEISAMGIAYTYHYWRQFSGGFYDDQVAMIDAREVIPIYSRDVIPELVAVIHCPKYENRYHVKLFTKDSIYHFSDEKFRKYEKTPHYYDRVPWDVWGSSPYQADISPVLKLVEAYDELLSDRQNWSKDSTQGLYVFNVLDILASEDGQLESNANAIFFKARIGENGQLVKGGEIDYLQKTYDVAGSKEIKETLYKSILYFTGVPDFADPTLYSQSGVALERRLLPLTQKVSSKWSVLQEGLKGMLDLTAGIRRKLSKNAFNVEDVLFRFSLNLPEGRYEEAKEMKEASGGPVSDEALLMKSRNFKKGDLRDAGTE